jgi:hypothetical protein
MTFRKFSAALAFAAGSLGSLLAPTPAHAEGAMILPEPFSGQKVRIDGLTKEWPGKFTSLSRRLTGGEGTDPRASGNVGYDETNLYVALDVTDRNLARTKGAGEEEDHATLVLGFPKTTRGFTTHRVDLYPGDPGKLPGVVRIDGDIVKGAKIVEAPKAGGFTLEAQIPWSAFGPEANVRVGLHGALRYTDSDSPGSIKGIIATSSASEPAGQPPMPLESEQGLISALIKPKGLSSVPVRSQIGNVGGGPGAEQVAVYGTYLSIVGPDYRSGKEFYFGELSIESAKMFKKLSLEDFDGDQQSEIVLRFRVGSDEKYRELLNVMQVGPDDSPRLLFSHEVGIKTDEGFVENAVKIEKVGSKARIIVSQGKEDGFDPAKYDEPLPGGSTHAALMPWDGTKARVFELHDKSFEAVDEQSWKPRVTKGGKPGKAGGKPSAPVSEAPPPPRPPTADELLDRVYALYRKDRAVGAGKPRFDFVTDVAGDKTTERVLIHGQDIVIFGKGFREGLSYTFISIGVADSKDIVHVTARDLTGDNKAEIIVRSVLHAKASKELGGDVVDRYALMIYSVHGEKLVRILGAETGRALGKNRILGSVAFAPNGKQFDIDLGPLRAIGWDEQSYPFPPDQGPSGGLEALSLPWGGAVRRYHFDGTRFTAE